MSYYRWRSEPATFVDAYDPLHGRPRRVGLFAQAITAYMGLADDAQPYGRVHDLRVTPLAHAKQVARAFSELWLRLGDINRLTKLPKSRAVTNSTSIGEDLTRYVCMLNKAELDRLTVELRGVDAGDFITDRDRETCIKIGREMLTLTRKDTGTIWSTSSVPMNPSRFHLDTTRNNESSFLKSATAPGTSFTLGMRCYANSVPYFVIGYSLDDSLGIGQYVMNTNPLIIDLYWYLLTGERMNQEELFEECLVNVKVGAV